MAPPAELPWEELHASRHAFVRRRVRDPSDVDDLVQRVLLQIVKGLDTLRDGERAHAWVYRTARATSSSISTDRRRRVVRPRAAPRRISTWRPPRPATRRRRSMSR